MFHRYDIQIENNPFNQFLILKYKSSNVIQCKIKINKQRLLIVGTTYFLW